MIQDGVLLYMGSLLPRSNRYKREESGSALVIGFRIQPHGNAAGPQFLPLELFDERIYVVLPIKRSCLAML